RERRKNPAYVASGADTDEKINVNISASGYTSIKKSGAEPSDESADTAQKPKQKKPEFKHISYKSKKNTKFKK
ncbi:MAG: hypothetical protein LBC13_00015, partial [Clostridiales bacterium]|nr:hypothetical protein [Clostridiales bacterium]